MKANILLVEDSPTQGTQTKQVLERLGYAVTWVQSGIDGLRQARLSHPDLVLLDVVMEDMDGFAVCRWLKLHEETRDIPVIMLTVKSEIDDRVEGLQIGADDYIGKPFADQELEARIYAALRVKQAHAELRTRNAHLEGMLHHVESLAVTDALTGLFNRRRFIDVLRREHQVTRRYGTPLSVAMVDIDFFKRVNDSYGHDGGDLVLRRVAELLVANVREVDLAARYGGEEFALVLPHTSRDASKIVADRLLRVVAKEEFAVGPERFHVTISVGIAANSEVPEGDADELVRAADLALYDAKYAGRNRACIYSQGRLARGDGLHGSLMPGSDGSSEPPSSVSIRVPFPSSK